MRRVMPRLHLNLTTRRPKHFGHPICVIGEDFGTTDLEERGWRGIEISEQRRNTWIVSGRFGVIHPCRITHPIRWNDRISRCVLIYGLSR